MADSYAQLPATFFRSEQARLAAVTAMNGRLFRQGFEAPVGSVGDATTAAVDTAVTASTPATTMTVFSSEQEMIYTVAIPAPRQTELNGDGDEQTATTAAVAADSRSGGGSGGRVVFPKATSMAAVAAHSRSGGGSGGGIVNPEPPGTTSASGQPPLFFNHSRSGGGSGGNYDNEWDVPPGLPSPEVALEITQAMPSETAIWMSDRRVNELEWGSSMTKINACNFPEFWVPPGTPVRMRHKRFGWYILKAGERLPSVEEIVRRSQALRAAEAAAPAAMDDRSDSVLMPPPNTPGAWQQVTASRVNDV